MVSIIISSANENYLKAVLKNIEETIGITYEVITVSNTTGEKGICEIYNQSAQKAKYDLLCFMHEDIKIETEGWGSVVKNIFADNPDIGLIGIAGTGYKALSPSGWEDYGDINIYTHIIQSYKYSTNEPGIINKNPTNEKLPNVACVDGVWFCTTKTIALEFPFDEQLFKGFHCYDLDFSLSVGQKYKVAITYDILLNHFSEGNYDRTWVDENLKFHKKWNKRLPLNVQGLTKKQSIKAEKETYRRFVAQLINFNYPAKTAFILLQYGYRYASLSFSLYLKLSLYTVKKFLKPAKV